LNFEIVLLVVPESYLLSLVIFLSHYPAFVKLIIMLNAFSSEISSEDFRRML